MLNRTLSPILGGRNAVIFGTLGMSCIASTFALVALALAHVFSLVDTLIAVSTILASCVICFASILTLTSHHMWPTIQGASFVVSGQYGRLEAECTATAQQLTTSEVQDFYEQFGYWQSRQYDYVRVDSNDRHRKYNSYWRQGRWYASWLVVQDRLKMFAMAALTISAGVGTTLLFGYLVGWMGP